MAEVPASKTKAEKFWEGNERYADESHTRCHYTKLVLPFDATAAADDLRKRKPAVEAEGALYSQQVRAQPRELLVHSDTE